jgi:predicted O-methyltransferase YrrM
MRGDYPEDLLSCIEDVFSKDHLLAPEDYSWMFASNSFYPLQRKAEMAKMLDIAKRISPTVVMEIGADRGSGSYAFCRALRPERMIVCEIRSTPYSQLFQEHFPDISFLFLEESSYAIEIIQRVKNWLGEAPIDLLFLDGDKNNYSKDWDAYLPMMSGSGIVLFHDVTEPGNQTDTFNAARRLFRSEVIVDKADTEVALHREKRGLPVENAYEGWLRWWRGNWSGVGVIYLDSPAKRKY